LTSARWLLLDRVEAGVEPGARVQAPEALVEAVDAVLDALEPL
jgi:hypothetical protein